MKSSFNLDLSPIKYSSKISCTIGNYLMYLSYIIIIAISIIVIYAMNQIEKSNCKCQLKSKKTFIKEWFIFIIFYQSFLLLFFLFSGEKCWSIFSNKYLFTYIYIVVIVIAIIHIIIVFKSYIYLNELRTLCKCAYNLPQKILYWYFLIVIALFITIIFLIVISIVYMLFFIYRFNNK